MTPYDDADLERDLRHALDVGDPERIGHLARQVDQRQRSADSVPLAAAALWYAENGLPVFPLQPGSKIPMRGSRGCKDATTDPDRVRTWWENDPEANIGLATGHVIDVVDIDGAAGQKSRIDNWDMFAALNVITKVTTPRPGGMHLYLPAAGVGNKAGLLPSVDYRGQGGYVVAPPSRTDQGTYRFLTPFDPSSVGVAAA